MSKPQEKEHVYIAIDLKSFYASVECVERGLGPLKTNLVVADKERTNKTICLAVSPSLKAHGLSGRARLFEVVEKVKGINEARRQTAPGRTLKGSSFDDDALKSDASLALDYIVAPPRMALYMQKSAQIYEIYLKHVAPEDIHVYSIDEVFMDITGYLSVARKSACAFASMLASDVFKATGITATVGIGTNLYLAKVAMDIVAKHMPPGPDGTRIAELDEMGYRKRLWAHKPLTDFWRVGRGISRQLETRGVFTMGDIALCSVASPDAPLNEDDLYSLFGVNAELLIDHAWGFEPCTLKDVKAYRPESNSLGSGQVLQRPYGYEETRVIVREMAEQLSLDLVEKSLITDQVVLTVGYDKTNLDDRERASRYKGEVKIDHFGRCVPKHAHGTKHMGDFTSSSRLLVQAALSIFEEHVDPALLTRRVTITALHVMREEAVSSIPEDPSEQLNLFVDQDRLDAERAREKEALDEENRRQKAIIAARKRFGKNAVLKGTNLKEGAMQRQRNKQIGGHRA